MKDRKKLTDILQQGADRERLKKAWKTTAAAAEFAPLPSGEYTFRVLGGELFVAKTGSPGYKLTLEVAEGEFEGRRAWHDLWLTDDAVSIIKRDLPKIGITDLEQLEKPLPPGILIKGKLALRRDDGGNESNKLKYFEFVGVEKGDAFEPLPDDAAVVEANGKKQVVKTAPDTSFEFGDNVSSSANGACKPGGARP